ncbi:hypothetical protein GGH91_002101 [Coemansia sp. RSA 2671]|nr:hypothetical protein GGH91_002101 [Coemansia sp. RSA 2671]
MAANMFGVAPQSAGCQVTAASSNSDSIPQQLGGFSVADIYLQPPLTFGGCPGILDVTMEAPTPLFMNANSFAINSPSVATSDPWSTTGTSARTARNEPTLTPEQSQCNTPGLAPKSHM